MTLQLHLVFLVLVAALVHAAWNAVVKASGERLLTFTAIQATGTVLGCLAAPVVGLPEPDVWPFLLLSTVVHNAYYVLLLAAYRHGDLSEVYPVARGSAPVLVAVMAALVAGEVPGARAALGVGLVSLGIVSLTFAGRRTVHAAAVPILLALLTGMLTAGYTVIDGLGMRQTASPWVYIVWLNLLEGIPLSVWVLTRHRAEARMYLRWRWKHGAGGGALAILAYGIVLYALSQGAMAHVAALRETSVLFAAVIGAVLLKEGFGRKRIAAAAVIAVGVIVLQVSGGG